MRTQNVPVQAYLANNPVCFDIIILRELTEVWPFSSTLCILFPLYAFIAQKILVWLYKTRSNVGENCDKNHHQLTTAWAPTATSSRTTEALPRPAARRKASPMSAAATPSATNCRTSGFFVQIMRATPRQLFHAAKLMWLSDWKRSC